MPNPNPTEMASSDDDEISLITDMEISPNKVNQGSGTNSNVTSDEGDSSVELDMSSFIRVRSEGDGIFEDDGDDEFDEVYSQLEAEAEVPTRKRKQEISLRGNELIELEDEDEPEFNEGNFSVEEQDIFQMRRRDRMPLYLLDPDDYAHDTKRQLQIRRAIVTYRHHQEKKAQIIRLTEESKKLREHTEALKAKVLEMASCGCRKNKVANLEVLDVKIPIVPPRMYVRGNRPMLAVPYNKCQFPVDIVRPSEMDTKHQLVKPFDPPPCPIKVPEIPKPLLNIASNRLQQISCATLSSVNVASTTTPPTSSHVTASGNRPAVTSRVPARATNVLQKNASSSGALGGGDTIVKTEPGIIPNQSSGAMTASRIVFAKGGSAAPQTASQLLFALKQTQKAGLARQKAEEQPPNGPSAPQRPSGPVSQPQPFVLPVGTFIRTVSGQLLRLVRKPNSPLPNKTQAPNYQPILPKPQLAPEATPPPGKRITKEDLKDMWSRFDDDDEDELAIIAAINSRSPSPEEPAIPSKKSRMQSMMEGSKRLEGESTSGKNQVIPTNGTEIELNKYADIVFEEAE